jgi:uncharacterized protein (TIGR00269 family)
MKCRKCEDKAVINMRQHKLALCGHHFINWFSEKTEHFIDLYKMFSRSDKILLAVSGGKDSLSLWEVLIRLGYKADGLYIDLGINGDTDYSVESKRYSLAFAQQRGLNLIISHIAEDEGATIPRAAELTERGKDKPCSLCGLTKRHVMNRIGIEGEYDVLVTGHNLDDEVALLFGNTLNWQVGYLARQGPVLEGVTGGFIRRAKPFCRFYERETAAYALLRGIEYIYEECPHSVGAKSIYHKEILNQMEHERPGVKLQFYLAFLRAKTNGAFLTDPDLEDSPLVRCSSCGQPTSAPAECAYCRTWVSIRERLEVR